MKVWTGADAFDMAYVGLCGLVLGFVVGSWQAHPWVWVPLVTSLPLIFFAVLTIRRTGRRVRARAERAAFTVTIAAYTAAMNLINSKGRGND